MPSQSDVVLALAAIAGELPAAALRRLIVSEDYRYKVIADLKSKKLIKLFARDGVKGYRLTAKAKELLLTTNPARYSFFLTGNADTNKLHTEVTRRLRLHRNAEAVITLLHAGAAIFPDEKPALFGALPAAVSQPPAAAFYFSREMKSVGEEHLKIRSSRASGLLLTDSELLLVYNTSTNLMKWEYQTELRCKVLMTSRFCQDATTMLYPGGQARALMLGADMHMALTLLDSTGGYKRQFFRLDGALERFYFAPNTPEGETQVKILCSIEIREELRQLLLSDLQPPQPGLRVEHDALRDDGVPVLLAYEFDMERLRRFRDSLQMFGGFGLVVCFDFQRAVLEEYLEGLVEFQAVSLEKVRQRFL